MRWNSKNGVVPIDDTEMSYVSFGQGKKNLILLPGLSDGLMTVRGKAALLAKPYRIFFDKYTVYMFSRKDKLPEGCTIREMAADQARAMKTLGIETASVMGVSQGGMIAQYFAIDYPEMIEKLIIAVSAPRANAVVRTCVKKWMRYAESGDHKRLMIDTAEKGYSPEYLKKYRRIYPIIGAIGKPSNYTRFLISARAILGFDAYDELGRIACPTLILGGAEDLTVGVQASYEMHERIAGSELYVYPGLGHAAYEEAKDFNLRVLEFLDK